MSETSIAALHSIAESADQIRSRVLAEIRTRGGATCDEVEVALGLRHQTASARIRELAEDGRVDDSGERRATRSGRKAVVWRETVSVIESFSGDFRFLSNFWQTRITYEGVEYPSTEHAYQAAKTFDQQIRRAIAAAGTSAQAKKMGRTVALRSDWENVKLRVMEDVLRLKFADPTLRAKLLATRGRKLVEGNTWGDRYWGTCAGVGENRLGRLLMKLRRELTGAEPETDSKPRLLEPPLKWPGKKTWLLPILRELYDRFWPARLVEPFVGSAAVALGLNPVSALLRDANLALINFYLYLQDGPVFSLRMENDEAYYYAARERFNELLRKRTWDCVEEANEAAELFYYLNRTCFNGLCRFNRAGEFNVPFGRYKTINYKRDFTEYQAALSPWIFECAPFDTSGAFQPGDFLFMDPPYDCDFVDYSAGGFTWEQQEQVAAVGAAHPGPVVVTNACTARILNLYTRHRYDIRLIAAPRSISANGDRGAVLEMVATKNI